jgi:hypothetical protein
MYCPHCGTENGADVNFCRKCGEDLRLTSEAMTRRIGWSSLIWSRVDERLATRHIRGRRDAGINVFIGATVALLTFYYVLTGQGSLAFWLVLGLTALLGVGGGLYDLAIHKRALKTYPREDARLPDDLSIFKSVKPATTKPREIEAAEPTNEIRDAATLTTPPSITETTTRHLDAPRRETAENP